MRGSPILRAVIVIIVLLLAAIPIWRLTHESAVAMDPGPASPIAEAQVSIGLTFAHAPTGFQVFHLGKVIWSGWEGKQPGQTAQKDFAMEFPKEGIDLEIKAEWPPGTPDTAVRVAVKHGYGTIEQTAWGKDRLDTVLTFTDPE